MRSADRAAGVSDRRRRIVWSRRVPALAACFAAAAAVSAAGQAPVHRQRYAMGTMFDIVAYHEPREHAERAISQALDEVVRLDQVLSHFKADSDLSRLLRDGRQQFVEVEPSLFEVIDASLAFSRLTAGTFDVTIGPLLKLWTRAHAEGRSPSPAEIAGAKRCVGFEKIELSPPRRIRLASDCAEIDLGGIGKGYAVDRALAIVQRAGIEHAVVNAGGSSIAAIGTPPGRHGWSVLHGTSAGASPVLLRNASLSTSQQVLRRHARGPGVFAEILDPHTGAPSERAVTVTVVAPRATDADALSTILVLLPPDDGRRVLARFDGVAALWLDGTGAVTARYGRLDTASDTH